MKLIFGEHEHEVKLDKYGYYEQKYIKKFICFKKYIEPTWKIYNQNSPENYSVIPVHRYYGFIIPNADKDVWGKQSVVTEYLPYFTKLVLLSRLPYYQINRLKLNLFSRGIIWLLYHSERAFNPKLYK